MATLRDRLERLQLSQILADRRAMVVFEGWDGAGRKAALRALAGAWDPCHFTTHCVRRSQSGSRRHWLAPYWGALPEPGESALFFGSWYRAIVDARVAGAADDKRWSRALDEINEFEAQQADSGTILVKTFFHISAETQQRRLRERGDDPWLRWTVTEDQRRNQALRDQYLAAWTEIFSQTDTRWAPWQVVDANDRDAGSVRALELIAGQFEKAVPLQPPATDATVVDLAQKKSA